MAGMALSGSGVAADAVEPRVHAHVVALVRVAEDQPEPQHIAVDRGRQALERYLVPVARSHHERRGGSRSELHGQLLPRVPERWPADRTRSRAVRRGHPRYAALLELEVYRVAWSGALDGDRDERAQAVARVLDHLDV